MGMGLSANERAALSLEGLSTGDAFGDQFFRLAEQEDSLITAKTEPPGPWSYTDDTEMAVTVVAMLRRHGAIEQGALSRATSPTTTTRIISHISPPPLFSLGRRSKQPSISLLRGIRRCDD